MSDENGIVSGNEVDLFFRSAFADETVRRECIALLADTIEYAHQKGNSVWSICLRQDKRISLNVGRCLVMRVGKEYVIVYIDTRALTAETRRVVKQLSHPYAEFKLLDDTESLEIPSSQLKQIFPTIRTSFLSLVDRAAETVALRTSYFKNHQTVLVDYIGAVLGRKIPQPNYSLPQGNMQSELEEPNGSNTSLQRYWKIAPGRGASEWEMCREKDCIVIGWSNLGNRDFREFSNKQEIEQALVAVGDGAGGAASIWNFVHQITPNDLVVANQGLTDVVGIGIITSEYIPPNTPQNPSTNSKMLHARRVEWRITKPVHVDFQFGQQTVAVVKTEQWQKIKQAYAEQHPELLSEIERLERGDFSKMPSTADDHSRQSQALVALTKKTRNIILYGPPGTGKTWTVNQFADAFLQQKGSAEKTSDNAAARNYWWMTINEKEWSWDVLFDRKKWVFKKRRIAKYYETAKAGDLVFCYNASPHREIMGLAQITQGFHKEFWEGEEREGITVIPIARVKNPIAWAEIQSNPILQESEPVSNRAQGTLFALSSLQANELTRLIQDADNTLPPEFSNSHKIARALSPQEIREQYSTFVTFHQSFAYEEFVEGLKPQEPDDDAGFVQYRVMPGVFKKICERAMRDPDNNYLLIIDEINRANISKVFGELITLIEDDKRAGEKNELKVRLPYSQQEFGVPSNLYLLGTMNTADRSIALLDIALRRRFTFVEMMPQPELVEENVAGVNLRALLVRINQRITALLDRDHQLGHSYLMDLEDADALRFAWYHRIVPLLQEYFYNDDRRLRAVLGKAFFEKRTDQVIPDDDASEMLDTETERFELRRFENDDAAFLDALRQIYS